MPESRLLIRLRYRQRGLVLLAVVALLSIVTMYYFVSGLNAHTTRMEHDRITQRALALGKEALIARSVTDLNRPGSLPCPDTNDDGSAESPVGTGPGNPCPSYIGRFPWRTLGVSDLRDAYGERLWYALSPNFRDQQSAGPLNASSVGQLSVGATPDVVAVLIAPGATLIASGPPPINQTGRPSNNATDYLEDDNANGDLVYVDLPLSGAFNDRLLVITRSELFSNVNKRVLAEIVGRTTVPVSAKPLIGFFESAGRFPWADNDGDGQENTNVRSGFVAYENLTFPIVMSESGTQVDLKDVLADNNWFSLVTYTVNSSGQEVTLAIGSTVRSLP